MDIKEVGYIVAIVIGVCQALKFANFPTRFMPLLAIALGIGGAFIFGDTPASLEIISGIVLGLASSGLYDVAKTTVLGQ